MSNMIKARYVSVISNEKKIIDSVKIQEKYNIPAFSKTSVAENEDGFVEGLQALFIDQAQEQNIEKASEVKDLFPDATKEKADQILCKAKAEAEQILQEAKQKADRIYDDVNQLALEEGYKVGLQKAEVEYQQKLLELKKKEEELRADFQEQLTKIEPMIASIISSYVERLTNIAAKYQEGIVIHLLSQTITGAKKSEDYIIRVSSQDIIYVLEHIDQLKAVVSEDASIRVIEDGLLQKNQCMIETDTAVIDCSLDVQLHQLLMDLEMLHQV